MARDDHKNDETNDSDPNDDGPNDGGSPLRPDEITNDDGFFDLDGSDGDFGLDDLDRLARRAVNSVLHLVRRANALAGGVLIFVLLTAVGGFFLGLSALSGGLRTIWVVLGGFFGLVAIGSVVTAMLRLRSVRRGAGDLVDEVRQLISGDRKNEQMVVETVASTEENSDEGIVQLSRQFFSMKGAIGNRVGQFRQLAMAMTAVTSFPGLVAIATLIGFAFAGLGVIFLISLVL